MNYLIKTRVEQVKTLHRQCEDDGIEPPFSLSEFEAGLANIELEKSGSESLDHDLNRFVLHHQKLLHELLYAPPRRNR